MNNCTTDLNRASCRDQVIQFCCMWCFPRCQKPREMGGLESPNIPLLADFSKKMSRDFGVLDEEEGISLR